MPRFLQVSDHGRRRSNFLWTGNRLENEAERRLSRQRGAKIPPEESHGATKGDCANMGRHKDGVSPVGYPPVARLVPASPGFGRLAGIDSSTGGYWFFDWRVLILRLAGIGSSTGGFWSVCIYGFLSEKGLSLVF